MTALDNDEANISADPETIDEIGRGETELGSGKHLPSRAAWALHEMRRGWNSVRSSCRSWGSCMRPTLTMSPTSRD